MIEEIKKAGPEAQVNPDQVGYLFSMPREKLASGRVLVHNNVRPQRVLGMNGFRAWTQKHTSKLVECDCKWAGRDLRGMRHYRVHRPEFEKAQRS